MTMITVWIFLAALALISIALFRLERTIRMATSQMTDAMTQLATATTSATTVMDSTLRFINGLAPLLIQNADNADTIRSIAGELNARATLLAQAVAANTIAEGAEEPVAMGGSGAGVTRTPESDTLSDTTSPAAGTQTPAASPDALTDSSMSTPSWVVRDEDLAGVMDTSVMGELEEEAEKDGEEEE